MEYGFIYKVSCRATGKMYIGQAKEFKKRNDRPYRYGIQGRWNDHVSSARSGATTPLADAILRYGRDSFVLEEIVKAPLQELDALEAKWIQTCATVVPHGYNVCTHSRNRHRTTSSLSDIYKKTVQSATLNPIRRNGALRMIYVKLLMKNGSRERIAFGQKEGATYEDARAEALEFLQKVGCSYEEDMGNSEIPSERYASKLQQFEGKEITRIRITTAGPLVAVYVSVPGTPQVRICFGGKTVLREIAYSLAQDFIDALPKNETTTIEDLIRSPQQVAAAKVETEPQQENSGIVSVVCCSSSLSIHDITI
jgi:hypothetical protein